MAVADTTTIVVQVLKEIQDQQKAAEASEGRNRRDIMRMFQELRTGPTRTATSNLMYRFFSLKIDFKEVSDEPREWNTWSMVYKA